MHPALKKVLSSEKLTPMDIRNLLTVPNEEIPILPSHTISLIWQRYVDFQREFTKKLRRCRKEGQRLLKPDIFRAEQPTVRRVSRPQVHLPEEPSGPLGESEIAEARRLITMEEIPVEPSQVDFTNPLNPLDTFEGMVTQPGNIAHEWFLTGEEEELATLAHPDMNSLTEVQQESRTDPGPSTSTVTFAIPSVTAPRTSKAISTSADSSRQRMSQLEQELSQWALLPRETVEPNRRGVKRKQVRRPMKLISYASYYLRPPPPEPFGSNKFPRPVLLTPVMRKIREMNMNYTINRNAAEMVTSHEVVPSTSTTDNIVNSVHTPNTPMRTFSAIARELSRANLTEKQNIPGQEAIEITPLNAAAENLSTIEIPREVPVENMEVMEIPLSAEITAQQPPTFPSFVEPMTPFINRPSDYSTPANHAATSMAEMSRIQDMSTVNELPSTSAPNETMPSYFIEQRLRGISVEKLQFIKEIFRDVEQRRRVPIEQIVNALDSRLTKCWKLGLLTELDCQLWRLEIDDSRGNLMAILKMD